MPNTNSAKKRVRQTVKRRSLNRWRKRNIKDQIKSFDAAIHEKDVKKAEEEFRKCTSILDRVATTSTIHRNNAARRKSRLSRRLKALQQAGG